MKRLSPVLAILALFAGLAVVAAQPARAERVKDIATIDGVRSNPLIGYGIVVGLDGTGDSSLPLTNQSVATLLGQLGLQQDPNAIKSKNVAAVMLTSVMPPYARPGQQLDVTISSLGNAKSLRGGTLLLSPLKGADGQIYALAQGNLMVGGAGASGPGGGTQINHLSAGRIPSGATVERGVPTALGQGDFVHLELRESDFTTASRLMDAVERNFGKGTAQALNGRVVRVKAPIESGARVLFMSQLENLSLNPASPMPRVIINPRTGSIVMNQLVSLEKCAIAHGNLSVTINTDTQVSQPNALSGGKTVVAGTTDVTVKSDNGELVILPSSATLNDVVQALNAVGATPQDLLAILQALKASGALKAELEVI
ncbi:MAG: flagellar biosynthesis protein FlgI [Hydrogenophilales bacterium 28-61-23]|nr:MAG: flagellar biosynthesis protein FlgI [Hydrogenophilales bacterium 28-61-23]